MPTTDPRYPGKQFQDWEFVEYPKYLGEDQHGRPIVAYDAMQEDQFKKLVVKAPPSADPAPKKPSFAPKGE